MTLNDIENYIINYSHRLTPVLCLAIAQEAAKMERKAIAMEVLEGTDMPMQKHILRIIRTERERISVSILQRVTK